VFVCVILCGYGLICLVVMVFLKGYLDFFSADFVHQFHFQASMYIGSDRYHTNSDNVSESTSGLICLDHAYFFLLIVLHVFSGSALDVIPFG